MTKKVRFLFLGAFLLIALGYYFVVRPNLQTSSLEDWFDQQERF